MKLNCCAWLFGLVLLAPAARAEAVPLYVDVDCDAGGNLEKVLRDVEAEVRRLGPRPVFIDVAGTCEANLVVTLDELILRGAGDLPATIQGAPELPGTPVLDARHVSHLYMRDLAITGSSTGVRLSHSLALLIDCRVWGNGTGLESENSRSIISRTRFEQNRNGIFASGGGHMLLQDSLAIDNSSTGVFVTGATVTIGSGEIRDNLFNLKLQDHASGFLREDLLIGQTLGGAPLTVVDNSHATLNDGVIVVSDDRVEVGNQSFIDVRAAQIAADIVLFRSGKAFLDGTRVEGHVQLYEFSQATLDGVVTGWAVCDATSDAACASGTIGGASGCAHCEVPAPAGPVPETVPHSVTDAPSPLEGRAVLRRDVPATPRPLHRGVLDDPPLATRGAKDQ